MDTLTLAYDVGGTRIKAGLVDADGHVVAREVERTYSLRPATDVLRQMESIGRRLMDSSESSIGSMGVAFTGVIDSTTGTVLQLNGKFPGIEGISVADYLRTRFELPIAVENDARAFAIGEWLHGGGRGEPNLVCMTIGTGIGSGVILNGAVLRTQGHIGGILGGHIPVEVNGRRCSCGNRGCLETVGSVTALLSSVKEALARGCESELMASYVDDAMSLTGEMVVEAADAGDVVCLEAVHRWQQAIGTGVVSMIHAYDPDCVVLGGGIVHSQGGKLLSAIKGYVAEHAWTYPHGRVSIRAAELGDDAALIGASATIRRYMEMNA